MAAFEDLDRALKALAATLGHEALAPTPKRSDWLGAREVLDRLSERIEAVFAAFDAAAVELSGEERGTVARPVAELTCDAAAVLYLAGSGRPVEVMRRAARAAEGTLVGELCAAAAESPMDYARLVEAHWLLQQGSAKEARAAAKALAKATSGPIAEAAQAIADAPTPQAPPILYTLNGVGTRLYGSRDARDDGTHVRTRYFTILYLPVAPLDAWRVRDLGRGWNFHGRVPLTAAATWWRRLGAAALVALVVVIGYGQWANSDGRRFEQAFEGAAAVDTWDAYAGVAEAFERTQVDRAALVEPMVRLATAGVPERPTLADAAAMQGAVARVKALTPRAQQAVGGRMAERMIAWAESVGGADDAAMAFASGLLGDARELSSTSAVRSKAEAARQELVLARAAAMTDAWPLAAIRLYAEVERSAEAVTAADRVLAGLPLGLSTALELADAVGALRTQGSALRGAEVEHLDAAFVQIRAAKAEAASAERQARLALTEVAALRAAVDAHRDDHALAVKLVEALRAAGDDAGAEAVLTGLGPPGRLTRGAQAALVELWVTAGRLDEAAAVAQRLVGEWLPRFEAARRAYDEGYEKYRAARVRELEQGNDVSGPDGRRLAAKLRRLESDDERLQVFETWLGEAVAQDKKMQALRAEYLALGDVVGMAMTLGTIELQRASGAAEPERSRLLGEAERVLLAIGAEAQGAAEYHLRLGQVYYRLGKGAAGEAEFAGLLAGDDAMVKLAVVEAYRGLGLMPRARAEAEKLVDAPKPVGQLAAVKMALMSSDTDERARWLGKADPSNPFVQNELLSIEADRLIENGDRLGADRKLAQVAALYEQDAASNPVAANNAALVALRRFDCTGDRKRLADAIRLMEQARALAPDNALLLDNLGDVASVVAVDAALAGRVPIATLGLDQSDLGAVLDLMLQGPEQGALRAALRASPDVKRVLTVTRQVQVLAPNNLSGWRRELEWLQRLRDDAGLLALRERIRGVTIEAGDTAAQFAALTDDSLTAPLVTQLRQVIAELEARVAKLPKREVAGRAVLGALRARALASTAAFSADTKMAAEAAAGFAAARTVWPAIGATDDEADARLAAGLFRRMEADAALAVAWRDGGVAIGPKFFADAHADAGLAAEAEVAAAAALRRANVGERPSLDDLLTGRIAKDAALIEASRAVLTRPSARAIVEIGQTLYPFHPGLARSLALFDEAG